MLNKCTGFLLAVLGMAFLVGDLDGQGSVTGWEPALPGWRFEFPADHAIHPKFKTEWWYFTGNLQDNSGHAYGYELTFFRQGVLPPVDASASPQTARSRFVQNDFKFAHFAISDLSGGKFSFAQKTSRGAFDEAGFGASPAATGPGMDHAERLAWLENWSLQPQADGSWRITARTDTPTPMSIDLVVSPSKPPVIEGVDGVSQKSAGLGNASHYYSFTRLKTVGLLALGGAAGSRPVQGESWFDHEWASNQLTADQVGWNWFCFQFDDQTELMLYAMRRRDGTVDPASSGTLVSPDGISEHLQCGQFNLRAVKSWHSQKTGAAYPVEWQVSIPSHAMEFAVYPGLDDQELVLPPISYWEGAIRATGRKAGHDLKGTGYMELTGYAGELKALQSQGDTATNLREPMH